LNKKRLIIPVLIALLLTGGYFFWKTNSIQINPDLLTLYGNIQIRETQLAFNSSEHIASVLVQEGDYVKEGQLLSRLHSEVLQAQLATAYAQLEAQKQTVAKLHAGSRIEEINKARAELEAAKVRAASATDSYKRLLPLVKKKMVSPDTVENARSLADSAHAEMNAVKQGLILLEAGPRKEDIANGEAILASRKAAVTLAQQRLDDANLYAPADGIIRNRILEPGDMAFPQTPAITLALVDPVWVRAYLSETVLGQVKPGMKATIYSDSFPGKTYKGWVGYISPSAEFTPKNIETSELRTRLVYSTRIFACNPEQELRLGMPVTVTINLKQNTVSKGDQHCAKQP